MKAYFKKASSLVLCTAMLLICTVMPLFHVKNDNNIMTAYAAEEDYPWSTYLKKDADWFGTSEAIAVADDCITYDNEIDFNKITTTSGEEYRMSADTLENTADYKIVAHTRFGEKIQSLVATLVKDADGIHTDTTD